MKSYEEQKLENDAAAMRGRLHGVDQKIAELRAVVDRSTNPNNRAHARMDLTRLEGQQDAYEAELAAIAAKLDPLREEREQREAEALPRLAAAREAYDQATSRVEAAANELAKLRDEQELAAAELLRVKNDAGTAAGYFDIPIAHRIEVGRLVDPASLRDVLIRWRR